MSEQELIIFIQNPEEGKVKTHIAQQYGEQTALALYRHLLEHTHRLSRDIPQDKALYYADFVDGHDDWEDTIYQKHRQAPGDLGHRLRCAFSTSFQSDYRSAVAILTNCLELGPDHLAAAFAQLDQADVVIGPAAGGSYYLIGMNRLQPTIFENMPWTSDQLLTETIRKIEHLDLTYYLLPELPIVHMPQDLERYPELLARLK